MQAQSQQIAVSFETLSRDGVLAPIHQAFGDLVRRLDPGGSAETVLAAALASEQLARGHTCLELGAVSELSLQSVEGDFRVRRYTHWPAVSEWVAALRNSPLVTVADEFRDAPAKLATPLVLDARRSRVYLARYWFYERELAANIGRRLTTAPVVVDDQRLANGLRDLFADDDGVSSRDQRLAVASAIDRSFCVVTGGPGTGKTTTVARLLALRLLEEVASGRDPAALKVLLMAPTGKAAQRLNESLGRAASKMTIDDSVTQALQAVTAGTIHRLLGWTPLPPERGGPFRHNAEHPLDADVVLVDEASMVDLSLMYRLFDAVPARSQIILMGDRDQLASVEAGGVLGDLCRPTASSDGTSATLSELRRRQLEARTGFELDTSPAAALESAPDSEASRNPEPSPDSKAATDSKAARHSESNALAECVVTLRFSRRFSADSRLGQFAAAIRDGDADTAINLLRDADPDQILWFDAPDPEQSLNEIVARAAAGYQSYLETLRACPAGKLDTLRLLNAQRVLCAHRDGRSGEVSLNRQIAERLAADGWLSASPGHGHFPGRPLMVTRNDYRLNLFNGDVGVVVRDAAKKQSEVVFEDPVAESGLRRLPSALVADARDCFAMTIHKSQGSEFHRVLLVLPVSDSPVLSRELLYTAVTRVKDETDAETQTVRPGTLIISASEAVLRATIERRIRRAGGIRDAVTELTSAK